MLSLRNKPTLHVAADADRFVAGADDGGMLASPLVESVEPIAASPPTPSLNKPHRAVVARRAKPAEPIVEPVEPVAALQVAPSFAKAHRAVVERRTKPSRRRTTVYLDLDIASMLAARIDAAASTGARLELSDLINDLLRRS